MTDEELDQARIDEAFRIWDRQEGGNPTMEQTLARISREGWMPVDPLLIEAREICAAEAKANGNPATAKSYRCGDFDDYTIIKNVIAALKRGIEIGKAS